MAETMVTHRADSAKGPKGNAYDGVLVNTDFLKAEASLSYATADVTVLETAVSDHDPVTVRVRFL